MGKITIIEEKSVQKFLQKRGLLKQYVKAVDNILEGKFDQVKFKKRNPKSDKIYQFRVNKQFRAFCFFKDETLIITEINNH